MSEDDLNQDQDSIESIDGEIDTHAFEVATLQC